MTPDPAPKPVEIDQAFSDLLAGVRSRDEVDRWAAHWVAADDPAVSDPDVWWALTILCGIDLSAGPNGPYLHPDEQVAEWLAEFRKRISNRA